MEYMHALAAVVLNIAADNRVSSLSAISWCYVIKTGTGLFKERA